MKRLHKILAGLFADVAEGKSPTIAYEKSIEAMRTYNKEVLEDITQEQATELANLALREGRKIKTLPVEIIVKRQNDLL